METEEVLRMNFLDSEGGRKTITVVDPKTELTGAEIKATMDLIIAKNIFQVSGGSLVSAKSAEVVQTNTTDMTLS